MFCTSYSLDTYNKQHKVHNSYSIPYLIIWKLGIFMSFPSSIPQQSNHSPQSKIIVILLTQSLFCQIIHCVYLRKENLVFTHVYLKAHIQLCNFQMLEVQNYMWLYSHISNLLSWLEDECPETLHQTEQSQLLKQCQEQSLKLDETSTSDYQEVRFFQHILVKCRSMNTDAWFCFDFCLQFTGIWKVRQQSRNSSSAKFRFP